MANNSIVQSQIQGNFLRAFTNSLGLGLRNFWRNKMLSIATVLVIAVIVFIFNVILVVHFIGNQTLKALSERVDVVIYLQDDVSFYDAQTFLKALKDMEEIRTATYTSKEEALEVVAKTHPKTAEFLKKFDLKNPLPPSISINLQKPEDYQKVENFLEKGEYKTLLKNYVADGGTGENAILSSVAKNLANMSRFVRQIIFWLVLVFVLGGTLVIMNAIQLTIYMRRQEINIMRLVGATPIFMRLPFIFEGVLYACSAIMTSFLFLLLLSKNIQIENSTLWNYYNALEIGKVFWVELAITSVLGVISSFAAVQQYAKGKEHTL